MTKKQRNAFYKRLLKEVCKDPDTNMGLCYYIKYNCGDISFDPYYQEQFDENLPELYSLKPLECIYIGVGEYWFECTYHGWEKRIALVEKAIQMSE